MILLSYVSWGALAYLLLRFVLPLGCGWPAKVLLALLLALVSSKYEIYEWSSGQFFAPDLPRWILLLLEAAYAALVLLFLLLVLRDAAALILWLLRCCGWQGAGWPGWLPPQAQRLGLAALALCCAIWGVWQGVRVPDVRSREIALPDAAPALDGLRVVQLSDLHIGPLLKRDWLEAVVQRVNALEADVIVITGDSVEGFPEQVAPDLAPLAALKARLGVYGVTGNHEYLYGVRNWLAALEGLGVHMLNNAHVLLAHNGAQLVLAGVTDSRARRSGGVQRNPAQALAGAPDDATVPRLLLDHRPHTLHANRQAGRVDVQLSGHTHGGVMFFLQPVIAAFNDGFVRGLYRVGETWLHVSPGTALWNGFSCRLGIPAEISLLVLRTGGKP